jgi:class 3 adenylate cyclase
MQSEANNINDVKEISEPEEKQAIIETSRANVLKPGLSELNLKMSAIEKSTNSNGEDKSRISVKDLDSFHTKVFDQMTDEEDGENNIEESKLVNPRKRHISRSFIKRSIKFSRVILKNTIFIILINLFTTFILFGDYLRIIIFRRQADVFFDVFVIISIFVFAFEFLLNVMATKKYVWSLYFWMDLVMCVFIVLNISQISNLVFYSANEKVTKITTKIAKFLRLIRLVRFLKYFQKKDVGVSNSKSSKAKVSNKSTNQNKSTKLKQSKVTVELKELNIKRLIILILVMWILIPLFDYEVYSNARTNTNQDKVSLILFNMMRYPGKANLYIQQIQDQLVKSNQSLAKLYVKGVVDFEDVDYPYLRLSDQVIFQDTIPFKNVDYEAQFNISVRLETVIQAVLDLLNTLLLGLIMILSIFNLNRDMSNLILTPLERMINKIKVVALNPLLALKKNSQIEMKKDEMNETLVIEEAINKISELLMLGFGQAGCRIISHILFEMDKDLDELFHGEKTYAIFGFCYITNFTHTTEVLQEDVMMFVNTIADIVHCSVDEFNGAANKNIGDAFLVVWKLKDDGYKYFHDSEFKSKLQENQMETSKLKQIDYMSEDSYNRQMAELSLLSFIQIVIEINTSPLVKQFSRHPRIMEMMPDYKIKMGFGLHLGWAIEGAIGSSFKIDASYLSPNVNMAARLEAATKQFGVDILFSGSLYNLFTTRKIIDVCRHIDTVMVKGSRQPVKLYTIDLNIKNLVENRMAKNLKDKKLRAIKIDHKDNLHDNFKLIGKKVKTIEENSNNIDIFESQLSKFQSCEEDTLVNKTLNSNSFTLICDFNNIVNRDYRQKFKFALNSYLEGDWSLSKKFFEKCFKVKDNDKPSKVLFEFMAKHNFVKPLDWKNCRELTEK